MHFTPPALPRPLPFNLFFPLFFFRVPQAFSSFLTVSCYRRSLGFDHASPSCHPQALCFEWRLPPFFANSLRFLDIRYVLLTPAPSFPPPTRAPPPSTFKGLFFSLFSYSTHGAAVSARARFVGRFLYASCTYPLVPPRLQCASHLYYELLSLCPPPFWY